MSLQNVLKHSYRAPSRLRYLPIRLWGLCRADYVLRVLYVLCFAACFCQSRIGLSSCPTTINTFSRLHTHQSLAVHCCSRVNRSYPAWQYSTGRQYTAPLPHFTKPADTRSTATHFQNCLAGNSPKQTSRPPSAIISVRTARKSSQHGRCHGRQYSCPHAGLVASTPCTSSVRYSSHSASGQPFSCQPIHCSTVITGSDMYEHLHLVNQGSQRRQRG